MKTKQTNEKTIEEAKTEPALNEKTVKKATSIKKPTTRKPRAKKSTESQKRNESIILSTLEFKLPNLQKEVIGAPLLFGYFGIFLMFIGVAVLSPLLLLVFYPKEAHEFKAFLIPGLLVTAIGAGLFFGLIYKRPKGTLTSVQDLLLVIGAWILLLLSAAMPFLFYGYSFTQAVFESTSGFTNAGLSVLDWSNETIETYKVVKEATIDGTLYQVTDVVSHMLFFHRFMTQLIGGTGLVLIVSSAVSERSSLNLYMLEGHNDKLLPNLAKSARLIFSLYLGIIAVGSLLYVAFGVNPFDAVCHSMAAVATGGFSTKVGSINTLAFEASIAPYGMAIHAPQVWRAVSVEIITEVLMFVGGTNFVVHYGLIRKNWKVLKHYEFYVLFATFVLFWPFLVIGMTQYFGGNFWQGLRYGTFDFLTTVSTTGFTAIDNYQVHMMNGNLIMFPSYLYTIIAILMCSGMQNGSTSAGIKQSRLGLAFLDIWWRIKDSVKKPEAVRTHTVYKFGHKVKVEQSEITEAHTYILFYVFIWILGSVIISLIASFTGANTVLVDGSIHYFNFNDCLFEFSSSLGDIGLSSGLTGYTTNPCILWIELIGMMLGRLEIFIYFILGGQILHMFKRKKFIYQAER